ncbi:hypothetical protein SPI_02920 [Niveomyces insectorum RCEF 264]|uniref:Uncharacterized protein n=1 Tax=Niveomyces insectorum RCEF 264 TaxID=1081102 RepID=A0A167WWT7_9HYPO|nr:hypothetical protein SPI_02920 [Niveomyces insectorum RCEF 264]
MSFFSIIKRSRLAAKDHTNKTTTTGKQKEAPMPTTTTTTTTYWHVPTHAASDALLGAPAGWVRDDADRIRAHNRQRIAMSVLADEHNHWRSNNSSSSSSATPTLSPMHLVNAHGLPGGSSSSSSDSSTSLGREPHLWPRPGVGVGRLSRSPYTAATDAGAGAYVGPSSRSYSSLNAELYRAAPAPLSSSSSSMSPAAATTVRPQPDRINPAFLAPPPPSARSPPVRSKSYYSRSRAPTKHARKNECADDMGEAYGRPQSTSLEMRAISEKADKSDDKGSRSNNNNDDEEEDDNTTTRNQSRPAPEAAFNCVRWVPPQLYSDQPAAPAPLALGSASGERRPPPAAEVQASPERTPVLSALLSSSDDGQPGGPKDSMGPGRVPSPPPPPPPPKSLERLQKRAIAEAAVGVAEAAEAAAAASSLGRREVIVA